MRSEPTPRTKASKRTRFRYVLFLIESSPPERSMLISQIQSRAPASMGAWLTRYEGGRGILRVVRGQEKAALVLLRSLAGLGVRTVSTSGTIAALERRHRDEAGRRGQQR
jgi:RNase P/RNase MRP subunit POP5